MCRVPPPTLRASLDQCVAPATVPRRLGLAMDSYSGLLGYVSPGPAPHAHKSLSRTTRGAYSPRKDDVVSGRRLLCLYRFAWVALLGAILKSGLRLAQCPGAPAHQRAPKTHKSVRHPPKQLCQYWRREACFFNAENPHQFQAAWPRWERDPPMPKRHVQAKARVPQGIHPSVLR